MKKCGGRCRKVCEHPTLFYISLHPLHFPTPSTLTHTLFHTSPTLSHPLTHFPTFSIFPHTWTQLSEIQKISQFFHHPYSPKFFTLPRFFSILPHTYFIIYLILKFLTFLIHCQISLAIKYTKPVKNFENQNIKYII